MSDRGCVLDLGRVRIEGPAKQLLDDPELGSLYLGGAPKITDEPSDGANAPGQQRAVNETGA
jgi:hypothetical protein